MNKHDVEVLQTMFKLLESTFGPKNLDVLRIRAYWQDRNINLDMNMTRQQGQV